MPVGQVLPAAVQSLVQYPSMFVGIELKYVVFSSGLIWSGDQEVGNLEQFGTKVYSISQTSQVWLDHHVMELDGDLVLIWDAADAVFEPGVLDAMFEAYCRTILVSAQLGVPPKTMSPEQLKDLLKIKQSLGIPDPRHGLKECELCDNAEWRPGVTCAATVFAPPAGSGRGEAYEASVFGTTPPSV